MTNSAKNFLEKFSGGKLNHMLLISIIVLSIVLRFWAIGSLGLSVPDSGNYVRMATWLIGQHGRPMYWEPPLYPMSISLALLIFGKIDYVAISVSAFYDVLAVLVVYLLGKELYDKKTGLMAALFFALPEFSIIYSRHALAETAFSFFMAASFLVFLKAFRRKNIRLYVLFGFLAGCTFLVKYMGVLSFLIPLLCACIFHAAKTKKLADLKKLLPDVKGFAAAGLVMALMHLPWIFAIGIGVYASSGGSSYFSMGDISPSWVASHATDIFGTGLMEYLKEFSRHSGIAATLANTSNYLFYISTLIVLVSPLIVAFFAAGVYALIKKRSSGDKFLLFWFFFIFLFFTFLVAYKASRFIYPAMPAFALISARGFLFAKMKSKKIKKLAPIILILIIASSVVLAADTLTMHNDGYRKTGEFINSNVKEGELIFYTGMPQLLFYHEINTGNWWRYFDYNNTKNIRHVVIESHIYHETERWRVFGFFDLERFENDFRPAAIYMNYNSQAEIEMFLVTGSADFPEKYREIKIYSVDRDISGYFNNTWYG